jgi:hypothetical protein
MKKCLSELSQSTHWRLQILNILKSSKFNLESCINKNTYILFIDEIFVLETKYESDPRNLGPLN